MGEQVSGECYSVSLSQNKQIRKHYSSCHKGISYYLTALPSQIPSSNYSLVTYLLCTRLRNVHCHSLQALSCTWMKPRFSTMSSGGIWKIRFTWVSLMGLHPTTWLMPVSPWSPWWIDWKLWNLCLSDSESLPLWLGIPASLTRNPCLSDSPAYYITVLLSHVWDCMPLYWLMRPLISSTSSPARCSLLISLSSTDSAVPQRVCNTHCLPVL